MKGNVSFVYSLRGPRKLTEPDTRFTKETCIARRSKARWKKIPPGGGTVQIVSEHEGTDLAWRKQVALDHIERGSL